MFRHEGHTQLHATKGKKYGHLMRRIVHILMAVVPLIYYAYRDRIPVFFHITPTVLLLVILAILILLEILRLSFGIIVFGQRDYEAKQISAFSWGAASLILVLLLAPGPQFGIPIIWSCSLGDPVLGELRQFKFSTRWAELIGLIFILIIWWVCAYWFGISWWWGVFLAPIIVAVEWLNLKWIDDNALMMLVPLFIILIVKAW